jgi:cyclopropane fatty-acyl-phospholipid synthase-like methyltransferase
LDKRVQRHFDSCASSFDEIYRGEKAFSRIGDSLLRRSIRARFDFTLEHLTDLKNKTVLDVGCGPGRYAVAFALRGAKKVIGIDFSQTMLDLAADLAEKNGVREICQFFNLDFLDFSSETKFDCIVALGFFDYIQYPFLYLKKMGSLNQGSIIASFPVKHHPLNWQRKVRYVIRNRPVYLYARPRIERLCQQCGFKNFDIYRLYRDYLLVARI